MDIEFTRGVWKIHALHVTTLDQLEARIYVGGEILTYTEYVIKCIGKCIYMHMTPIMGAIHPGYPSGRAFLGFGHPPVWLADQDICSPYSWE